METRFVFFDKNEGLVQTYREVLAAEAPSLKAEFVTCDFKQLFGQAGKFDAIVSPANSTGYMDGGIDLRYTQLFFDIQRRTRDMIRSYLIKPDGYSQYLLPIGSAVSLPTCNDQCPLMICAPTMVLPGRIEDQPENVRDAFHAILQACKRPRKQSLRVAVPGLGTMTGKLSAEESARQIIEGIADFTQGIHRYPIREQKVGAYVVEWHAV